MKKVKIWVVAACLSVVQPVAVAQSAAEQFQQFSQTFSAATGQFEQFLVPKEGSQAAKKLSGQFSFQRPGKFRWEVLKPYEQVIVSDGKDVYQFDPDLNQVTVRPVASSLGSSPAAILFGNASLDEAFVINNLPDSEGMSWLRATPHQPDSGLNQIDIGLYQGVPARLILQDSFGQTTQIDLSRIRAQSGFPADTFRFKAPPGADIVRMQQ